jgi:serine protease Do
MHRALLAVLLVAPLAACRLGDATMFASDAHAAGFAAAPAQAAAQGSDAILPGGSGGDAPLTPLPSLAPLVKRLRPVVVNINSKYKPQANKRRLPQGHPNLGQPNEDEDDESADPMERFFRRFGNPGQGQGQPDRRERSGLGSGFLLGDGLVITNNHVAQIQEADGKFRAMDEIKVITDDQAPGGSHEYAAKLIGADPKADLALLRMEDPKAKALPGAILGDSDATEVGDYVVAIGEPFGLQATVSSGIISAKGRDQIGGPYSDYLQTDASINPGNSGGPLFNLRGEVIGVNSAIISGANTIGFAIPIGVVKQILPQLKEKGKVVRGFLGVQPQPLTQDTAEQLGLKSAQGALVADVVRGSPAEKAGLEAGDVITQVNGKPISDAFALTREVGSVPPGQKVKVDYVHKGKSRSLDVTVAVRPDEDDGARAGVVGEGDTHGGDPLGLSVDDLTPDLARRARIEPGTRGVLISEVAPESAAGSAGLEPGDMLVEVAREPVNSVADYRKAIKGVKAGDTVLLRLRRGNQAQYLTLRVPK